MSRTLARHDAEVELQAGGPLAVAQDHPGETIGQTDTHVFFVE
jgi:hypothetical protein